MKICGFALSILLFFLIYWILPNRRVPARAVFPTALMVGELASAMPEEGGFYQWVKRAMGPFWGFQEAWLSLAASVFDMAIYPTTFVLYLSHVAPSLTAGHRGVLLKLVPVIVTRVPPKVDPLFGLTLLIVGCAI